LGRLKVCDYASITIAEPANGISQAATSFFERTSDPEMDGVEASPLKLQHWTPQQLCVDKNAGKSLQRSPEENRQTRGIIFAQHETIGPDGAHEKKVLERNLASQPRRRF
jgi:hypothetical protein